MMDRCRNCNATLKSDETECFTCGSTRVLHDPKKSAMARCATAVKVLFILSGLYTVASLFLPATPSFIKCFATTVILMFVNRSAEAMAEKQKG